MAGSYSSNRSSHTPFACVAPKLYSLPQAPPQHSSAIFLVSSFSSTTLVVGIITLMVVWATTPETKGK